MTICICGSQTFGKEMEQAQKNLSAMGFKTHAPELFITEEAFSEEHTFDELLRMKPIWTKTMFKKIEEADAVLIMNLEKKNIKGYFGPNTLMELTVAFYLDKDIYFMQPVGEDHPFYQEIAGIEHTVIYNDLDSFRTNM